MQERQPRRMNDLDKATRLAGHEQDSQSRVPHASTVERRGFGRRPVERADDDRGGSAAPRLSESAFSHRHGPARISRAGLFSCAASSKDRRSNHCRGRRCQRRLGCWQRPPRWDSDCCAGPKSSRTRPERVPADLRFRWSKVSAIGCQPRTRAAFQNQHRAPFLFNPARTVSTTVPEPRHPAVDEVEWFE